MSEKTSLSIHEKYADALRLYTETKLTGVQIAKQCNVPVAGFRAYLYRYHRDLLLVRYGMEGADDSVKIHLRQGERPASHVKYKKAVEACDSLKYIRLNISEIARMFGLSATGLNNFMRLHYPEILERREKERVRQGICSVNRLGPRMQSKEMYEQAVEMYNTTDKTIPEVAEACQVSLGGLSQYLRFYHKKVIKKRSVERAEAKHKFRIGHMTGNGKRHVPEARTVERYREALELYQHTDMIVKDIAAKTGVPVENFRYYLRTWHRDLMLERRGGDKSSVDRDNIDLSQSKRYLKSAAGKYAAAIACLKESHGPVAAVAAEYGLHPETFRMYLREHEPELARMSGMARNEKGKLVLRRAAEKYAEAIRLYETTAEDMKSIAKRLGIVYNSLGGYIRRNCPESKLKHEEAVRKANDEGAAVR